MQIPSNSRYLHYLTQRCNETRCNFNPGQMYRVFAKQNPPRKDQTAYNYVWKSNSREYRRWEVETSHLDIENRVLITCGSLVTFDDRRIGKSRSIPLFCPRFSIKNRSICRSPWRRLRSAAQSGFGTLTNIFDHELCYWQNNFNATPRPFSQLITRGNGRPASSIISWNVYSFHLRPTHLHFFEVPSSLVNAIGARRNSSILATCFTNMIDEFVQRWYSTKRNGHNVES